MRKMRWALFLLIAGCGVRTHSAPVQPVQEIVAGAGRIHGGGVVMDVQIGRAPVTVPVHSTKAAAKPDAAVLP